jgi:hypothetical protein
MSKITAGEILVAFDGEELVLKPTLNAMTMISRQYGGLGAARTQLVQENIDAIAYVLRVGAGMPAKDGRNLGERIYRNGVDGDLLLKLIRYVAVLGNGGRPLPDDEEADASEDRAGGAAIAGAGADAEGNF